MSKDWRAKIRRWHLGAPGKELAVQTLVCPFHPCLMALCCYVTSPLIQILLQLGVTCAVLPPLDAFCLYTFGLSCAMMRNAVPRQRPLNSAIPSSVHKCSSVVPHYWELNYPGETYTYLAIGCALPCLVICAWTRTCVTKQKKCNPSVKKNSTEHWNVT